MTTANYFLRQFACALFLIVTTPHLCQAWGIVQGTVEDAGSPIPGALVATPKVTMSTASDGTYQMFHLPGTFTATASASGYLDQAQQVAVVDAQTTPLDFSLTPSPPPLLEKVNPSLGEMGNDLHVTIEGAGFDEHTRLSMYLDSGNGQSVIGSLATDGAAEGVTVVGNVAYIADGMGLRLVDVSNPATPAILGGINTPSYAYAVTVKDGIAYVADFSSGLQLIDVSDPLHPAIISSVDTPGAAQTVALAGGIAYVADNYGGLQVVNVSDPANPAIIASLDTPGSARDIKIVGTLAYVADDTSGLQIVDVSNPSLPVIIGSVYTYDAAWGVAVVGDAAYVAAYDSGLQIIDISDPVHPAVIGAVHTPGIAYKAAVKGDVAYVANGASGLNIIDVRDSFHPVVIGSVDTPGKAVGVDLDGMVAYVADFSSGLQAIDVSNPSIPVAIGSVETPGAAQSITIVGSTAYVADFSGLQVVDISDPFSPVIIGGIDTPGYAFELVAAGNIVYVADGGSGLQVIDVSDPVHPVIIGAVDTPGMARQVKLEGSLIYLADDWCGLQIIDVSDPYHPAVVGSVDTPGNAFGVTVVGGLAYVADTIGGLQVVDVSDPLHPVIAGNLSGGGAPYDVTVSGDKAYVAATSGGLLVVDVSDPLQPAIIGSADTPGSAQGVVLVGNIAYVEDAWGGIQVIDVQNPFQPVIISAMKTLQQAAGVSIVGNLAFVVDPVADLVVLPIPVEITPLTVNNSAEITATLPSPILAGNYTLRAFNNLEHSELLGAATFTDRIDLLHAKAIIVAGGGPNAPGNIWQETKAYAQEAYNSLIYQGYKPENIYYLTDDGSAEGRTGPPSSANLQYAITDWADNDLDTKSLVLYMVDHGEDERFQLRGNANPALSEYLAATELDSWLDTLQANVADMKILVVYDACHSGSFVETIREQNDTRVVIASVERDEVAYFLDLKRSFSGVFWGTLSGRTGSKGTLYNAWSLASNNMATFQTAQLDANGNGVANEPEDIEALENNIFEIGREWFNAGHSRPVVNVAAADQTLDGELSATLSARGVYDIDHDDIVRVWAEVSRPDFTPDPGVTVTSLPSVDLSGPDGDGVYSATFPDDAAGPPAGFDVTGTYIISYYAEDASGVYSEPRISLVTQNGGTPTDIPDAYEDDDVSAKANVIVVNDPAPQEHSFHDSGDEDWALFYGIAGTVYNIRAMNPTVISDPAISLYNESNPASPLISSNAAPMGVEEAIANWTCPEDGVYYVRIANSSGHYGANVRYQLKVYNPIALSLPGYVTGTVSAGGAGIGGAVLRSGGASAISLPNGSYAMILGPGTHSVSVSKAGYRSTSVSVSVSSSGSTRKNVSLLPNNAPPAISGTPATTIHTNALYTFTPNASDPDGDSLTFSGGGLPSWAEFNTATGTLSGVPDESHIGTHGPITITVSDSQEQASLPQFTITVYKGDNLPPVLSGSPPGKVGADRMFDFIPISSDPNGDSLTFTISGKPSWAAFSSGNGRLSGIPGESNIGIHGPITITAHDPSGAYANLTFNVAVVPGSEIDRYGALQGAYLLLRE